MEDLSKSPEAILALRTLKKQKVESQLSMAAYGSI